MIAWTCLFGTAAAALLSSHVIVPAPQTVLDDLKGGVWQCPSEVIICTGANSADYVHAATDAMMKTLQLYWGTHVTHAEDCPTDAVSVILQVAIATSASEAYTVDIGSTAVVIAGDGPAGVFYGVQSVVQLIEQHKDTKALPMGRIADKPLLGWRGVMLDVARHFFPVDVVLRLVDNAARYKINRLHLHLSDDQGWRLEIKSMPRLTAIGSRTTVGRGQGGFYTQEDYVRIVKYAAARFITVVPEFDMPGHTYAIIASYPSLRGPRSRLPSEGLVHIPDSKMPLYSGIAVGFSCLDIAKDLSYMFVERIVREVAAITPGPYIHIGGDEAEACPHGDAFAGFIQRASDIVRAAGKTPLGWQEAGGKGVEIQQLWWPSRPMGRGMKTIMSPANKSYLDMKYSTGSSTPGLVWAGCISARDAYSWDPIAMAQESGNTAVGVEAPLWTETIVTEQDIYTMIMPRMPALAEVAWISASQRSWDSFARRIAEHAKIWALQGISFYRTPEIPWDGTRVRGVMSPVLRRGRAMPR